jgi:nickel-type superoxide dismutase maturation protease
MEPALRPGDRLVVWKAGAVRPGDIVAANDPRRPERVLVKRASGVSAEGVTLLGDNPPASTDSRNFGAVAHSAVRGRAVYRYAPPERAGRLRRGSR